MTSAKIPNEEDLKGNGALTAGNNEIKLPFGEDFYKMENAHSLTSKDDNNCSNKEQEKKKLIMTESQVTYEETYPKHRDKNFNTREEQQEFNILNDVNNLPFPQKIEISQQLQKSTFLQISQVIPPIDHLESLKKEDKTVKAIESIFKSTEKENKDILNSSSNFSINDKQIDELTLNNKNVSFPNILNNEGKQNHEKNETKYEKNAFKKDNNQFLNRKRSTSIISELEQKNLDIPKIPDKFLDITNYEGYNKTKLDETNKKNIKHDRNFETIFLTKSMRHGLGSLDKYIAYVIEDIGLNIKLGRPVIPNEYVKNTIGKEQILNMNIKELYCFKNEKNERKIEELFSKNVEGKEDELQLLRIIFNIKYERIFLRFMNDKNYITIMNNFKKEKIILFKFETFCDVFLDYDKKPIEKVKLKASNLINGEIKKRKPRNGKKQLDSL